MFKVSKVSRYVWLWALFAFFVCTFVCAPVQARLGDTYHLDTLLPFVEQGFVTRSTWEGAPLTSKDPHLYLYDPQRHAEWAVLEFGVKAQKVHSVLLKWRLDMPEHLRQRIFLQLLSQYAEQRVSLGQFNRLLDANCQGEMTLPSALFFTVLKTETHGFLKLSRTAQKGMKPLNPSCFTS